MDNDELGNVYLILIGNEQGNLAWNIVQPLPIGAMIEAAAMLDAMAKRYVVAPAPQEQPEPEAIPENEG